MTSTPSVPLKRPSAANTSRPREHAVTAKPRAC